MPYSLTRPSSVMSAAMILLVAAGCTQQAAVNDPTAVPHSSTLIPSVASPTPDMSEVVAFRLGEFTIDAGQTTFQTGVPYRFRIHNEGALAHDFRLLPRGESAAMAAMHQSGESHEHGTELILIPEADLPPGKAIERDIIFHAPGEYEIACHVAGHLEAGMVIPILVEGETLVADDPSALSEVKFDAALMPDAPCHRMGMTITGNCRPEELVRLTTKIVTEQLSSTDGTAAGGGEGHPTGPGSAESTVVIDLDSRSDGACHIHPPNAIAGDCSAEDVARLVAELMAQFEARRSPDMPTP